MLPRPTADPTAARTNPQRLCHCSRAALAIIPPDVPARAIRIAARIYPAAPPRVHSAIEPRYMIRSGRIQTATQTRSETLCSPNGRSAMACSRPRKKLDPPKAKDICRETEVEARSVEVVEATTCSGRPIAGRRRPEDDRALFRPGSKEVDLQRDGQLRPRAGAPSSKPRAAFSRSAGRFGSPPCRRPDLEGACRGAKGE